MGQRELVQSVDITFLVGVGVRVGVGVKVGVDMVAVGPSGSQPDRKMIAMRLAERKMEISLFILHLLLV